ncbi:MAG: TIGR02281 family clan AA aspartic protease [Geminicoccaceae bacterium]
MALIWLVVLAGLVLGLNALFPGVLAVEGNQMRLVYGIILLAFLGGGLLYAYRGRHHQALKHGLGWIAVGLALAFVYLIAERSGFVSAPADTAPSPPRTTVTGSGDVELAVARDGHFYADSRINGTTVRLLVDTGASLVALSKRDARRVGIDTETLNYSHQIITANGPASVAIINLDVMEIGDITARNVQATIPEDNVLDRSLLGMSFLNRLSGFERAGDRFFLKP